MIDEQSPASGHDYASNRWAIGAEECEQCVNVDNIYLGESCLIIKGCGLNMWYYGCGLCGKGYGLCGIMGCVMCGIVGYGLGWKEHGI